MHRLHQQKFFHSASFSVTFLLLFGPEFWHKIFRCERISQKQSKKSQKCRVNSVLILRKFCTNSGILCKFWSSKQILEFCANSVQFLEFSNTRIFHPTGFHDRISSNFLIISFTISGLEILGGKIPDQKVTEKCRKNCTE